MLCHLKYCHGPVAFRPHEGFLGTQTLKHRSDCVSVRCPGIPYAPESLRSPGRSSVWSFPEGQEAQRQMMAFSVFPFLFHPGLQPMKWCHSQSGWVFPDQLSLQKGPPRHTYGVCLLPDYKYNQVILSHHNFLFYIGHSGLIPLVAVIRVLEEGKEKALCVEALSAPHRQTTYTL